MIINIVVAEQERMMRECMVRILEKERDFRVVGQVGDGREAVVMAGRLKPGVVVVDFDLPSLNGIETVRRMQQHCVPSVMVCTTMGDNRGTANAALQAGASACLGQGCSPGELLEAIRRTVSGVRAVPARQGARGPSPAPCLPGHQEDGLWLQLTPREREVLQLIAEGYITKEISDMLSMSVKTVSTHRVHIKEKVGTRSIALLTKLAIRVGLTHL